MKIVKLTSKNLLEETLFCIKDVKSPGFNAKAEWFKKRVKEGLTIKLLKNQDDKPLAFIEYIPASDAWRPIEAEGMMFIQCMFTYSKAERNKGVGSYLIKDCERDAQNLGLVGVCSVTSSGGWMTDKRLFERNGYHVADQRDRFELMSKTFNGKTDEPRFFKWELNQSKYSGWNLIYADQCPWHEKAVMALSDTAYDVGIDLKIHKLTSPKQARKAPSGYGTFSLIRDGRLLEDHYISQTRFRNILKKELA